MRHLLKVLFVLFLTSNYNFSFSQELPVYTIQVGRFQMPEPSHFEYIRNLGFVYSIIEKGDHRIINIGGFTNKDKANDMVKILSQKGYFNPRVKTIKAGEQVKTIQLTTKNAKTNIDWSIFPDNAELYAYIIDDAVKITSGLYEDKAIAKAQIQYFKKIGFKDAFIASYPRNLLHKLTAFEKGDFFNKNIIAQKSAPQKIKEEKIVEPKKEFVLKPVEAIKTPLPQTRVQPRNSSLRLQTALKNLGYCSRKIDIDGKYGKETTAVYKKCFAKNEILQKYRKKIISGQYNKRKSNVQYFVDNIPYDINGSILGLKTIETPIAKAYTALAIFLNQEPGDKVNSLLNEAVKQAYKTKKITEKLDFEPNATYDYNNLELIFRHIGIIHQALKCEIEVPCWIFKNYPKQANTAFYDNKELKKGIRYANCGGFEDWEIMQILEAISKDLSSEILVNQKKVKEGKLTLKQLFLKPEKIKNQEEIKKYENWHIDLMKTINNLINKDKNTKDIGYAFSIAYLRSYIYLEDYFMDKKFLLKDATTLSQKALYSLIEPYLEFSILSNKEEK